jgi:hypothetical protein
MTLPRVRFKIWWVMVATATLALVLAWIGGVGTLALLSVLFVGVIPVACSPPKRRRMTAVYAAALYPVMISVYLYLTWLTAWCVLGHRPRPYLDDPKLLGPIFHVPAAMFFLSIQSWPIVWKISAGAYVILTVDWLRRQSMFIPLLIPPCAWLVAFVTLMKDPMGILRWYFD